MPDLFRMPAGWEQSLRRKSHRLLRVLSTMHAAASALLDPSSAEQRGYRQLAGKPLQKRSDSAGSFD
jgi:hypothetical protein